VSRVVDATLPLQLAQQPLDLVPGKVGEDLFKFLQSAALLPIVDDVSEQQLLVRVPVQSFLAGVDALFAQEPVDAARQYVSDTPASADALEEPQVTQLCRQQLLLCVLVIRRCCLHEVLLQKCIG